MLLEHMVSDSVLSQASRCSQQPLERGREGGVTVRSGTRFAEGDSMRRGRAGTKSRQTLYCLSLLTSIQLPLLSGTFKCR